MTTELCLFIFGVRFTSETSDQMKQIGVERYTARYGRFYFVLEGENLQDPSSKYHGWSGLVYGVGAYSDTKNPVPRLAPTPEVVIAWMEKEAIRVVLEERRICDLAEARSNGL
jgi:hypothetical protein